MELRSSRSRSRTPFLQNNLQDQIYAEGNQIEETIVRTTRSTTVKSFENVSSSSLSSSASSQSSKALKSKSGKSDKSVRKTRYKTSDYSSEEGEGEVTSSRIVTENDKNQLIEDARSAANGSAEISALGLYRKAGRYWDVYPKTDWTYSRHSRDRVELAPGVVAMPNMSRRSLHSQESPTEHLLSHRKTMDTVDHSYSNYVHTKYQPRTLFTNNNYNADHEYTVSSYRKVTWYSRFVRVFTAVFSVLYYVFEVQRRSALWFGKKVHKAASYVMLWDTWLLRRQPRDKLPWILLLCLLPLLFFGGWYLISTLGQNIYGAFSNFSTSTAPVYNQEPIDVISKDRRPIEEERIIKITEKIHLEPPTAGEIAAGLTAEQLETIAASLKNSFNREEQLNADLIVERVLASPDVQNVVKKYYYNTGTNQEVIENQGQIIEDLKAEINEMRARNEDITKRLLHFQAENKHNYARLRHEMTRCCRRSFVDVETYVARAVKDFFASPDFAANRDELSSYLRSIFVAKQDLETRLANLTQNLQSNFDNAIENTGKRVMDEISGKIALELKQNAIKHREVSHGDLTVSDDHVRAIVHDVLSIYDADKTGLVDYAMEPMGGQVVSTKCTESYRAGTAVYSIFGIPLYYPTASPRAVITPGKLNPGECWAFQNFPGFLIVKLARPVRIEAFSYEHISKMLIAKGNIDSAPREFEVYGLKNETDTSPVMLARFRYDHEAEPLQFFTADSQGSVFDMIELRVLSNHGNPNYTCLYRFRVHGSVSEEPT